MMNKPAGRLISPGCRLLVTPGCDDLRLYLDVCCYCRPYDDKTGERVRLEADAVLSILERCRKREWILVGSVAIDEEISYITDYEKRDEVVGSLAIIHDYVTLNSEVLILANVYESYGLHIFDALHCAFATVGNAIFLTTDDHIITTVMKNPHPGLIVHNPVKWLMEVNDEDYQ